MEFLWPEALVLLLLVPLVAVLYVWLLARRKRVAVRYAKLPLVREAMGRGPGWRRHVPPVLFLLALTCMLLAVARPTAVVTLPSQHKTVVLAMDVSGSMRATDVQPNRLVAAQEDAKAFIADQPPFTRIGIVSFAGTAALVQPPTQSREDLNNDLGGWCTYCCPIVIALTLYGAFQNWSPPETMTESETYMLDDLRTGIERLKNNMNHALVWERRKVVFADPEKQKWYERIESLPLEELICLTGPENADLSERYFASHALAGRTTDNKNLAELYWLAIEELEDDASGIYLCSIYEAIERAEIARAQKDKK